MQKQKHKLLFIITFIVLALAALALFGTYLYAAPYSKTKDFFFKSLNLPIAQINGHTIFMTELAGRQALANKLTSQDSSFNASSEADIFNKLAADTELQTVSSNFGVSASQSEVQLLSDHYKNAWANGDEAKFKTVLAQSGLTEDSFKAKVLPPLVLQAKLTAWYNSQKQFNQNVLTLAEEIKAKADAGGDFSKLASGYNQDVTTLQFSGDSGFISLSDVLPELLGPLSTAKPGDVIVAGSRYGVHAIKVLSIDSSSGQPKLQLQQIFLKETGFDQWYRKAASAITVKMFVNF